MLGCNVLMLFERGMYTEVARVFLYPGGAVAMAALTELWNLKQSYSLNVLLFLRVI